MKLKTLKDIKLSYDYDTDCNLKEELKAEAVKWAKEDYSIIEMIRDGLVVNADYFTKRWMIRLDINEEDLK